MSREYITKEELLKLSKKAKYNPQQYYEVYLKSKKIPLVNSSQDMSLTILEEELSKYLSSGVTLKDAQLYFSEFYNNKKTWFKHHEDGIEITSAITMSSKPINTNSNKLSNSSSSLNSNQNIDYKGLRKGKEDILLEKIISFYNGLIEDAKKIEDENLEIRKQANPSIESKKDVIKFFMEPSLPLNIGSSTIIQTASEFFTSLLIEFESFSQMDAAWQRKNVSKLQQTLKSKMSKIDILINSGLEDSQQMWSLLSTMNGDFFNYLNIPENEQLFSIEDYNQLNRAGRTFTEFLEKIALTIKYDNLKNNIGNNISSIEILNVGSARSKLYQSFLDKKGNTKGKNFSSTVKPHLDAFARLAITAAYNKKLKRKTEEDKVVRYRNIMQGSMDPSGGKSDKVDILINIGLKTNKIVQEKIDIKFGAGYRYSSSSNIGGVLSDLLSDSRIGSSDFNTYLHYMLSLIMLDAITNNPNTLPVEDIFKAFGTYLVVSTNNFLSKFGFDDIQKNAFSDHFIIGDTYIWMSDFLQTIRDVYLIKKSKGQRASFKTESLIENLKQEAVSKLNHLRNFEKLEEATKDTRLLTLARKTMGQLNTMSVAFNIDIQDYFVGLKNK